MNEELPMFEQAAATEIDVAAERAKIDAMDYEAMFRMIVRQPLDHPMFLGRVGLYFHAELKKKRQKLSPERRYQIHCRTT